MKMDNTTPIVTAEELRAFASDNCCSEAADMLVNAAAEIDRLYLSFKVFTNEALPMIREISEQLVAKGYQ
jgi:hypothetical protein